MTAGVTRHSTTGRYEAHLWDAAAPRPKSVGSHFRCRAHIQALCHTMCRTVSLPSTSPCAFFVWLSLTG